MRNRRDPEHDEVLIAQREASLLLLLVNDTPNAKLILTGKLFEYLAAQRNIICIGPKDGDAAPIANTLAQGNNAGHMAPRVAIGHEFQSVHF